MKSFVLFQVLFFSFLHSSYSSAVSCKLLLDKQISLFTDEDTFFNNSEDGELQGTQPADESYMPASESEWLQLKFGSISGLDVDGMYVRVSLFLNGKNEIIEGILNAKLVTHRVESTPVGISYAVTTLIGTEIPITLGSRNLDQLMSIKGMTKEAYFEAKFKHQPTLKLTDRVFTSGDYQRTWKSLEAIQEATTWSFFRQLGTVDVSLNNQRIGYWRENKVIEGVLKVKLITDSAESFPLGEEFYLFLDNGQTIKTSPEELDGYKLTKGYVN